VSECSLCAGVYVPNCARGGWSTREAEDERGVFPDLDDGEEGTLRVLGHALLDQDHPVE
jgi:hypothetical protein